MSHFGHRTHHALGLSPIAGVGAVDLRSAVRGVPWALEQASLVVMAALSEVYVVEEEAFVVTKIYPIFVTD